MISYPISNLHKKVFSDKSSCECNNQCCDTICTSTQSNASVSSSSKYCAKEININNNNNCCDDGEKVIDFCENHTRGILKITKLKGNLGAGILKIIHGNCINLDSRIFKGLISLSIINNTQEVININYNKNKKCALKLYCYIIFKRKHDCKWEIIIMYELKNKCENYYYKAKKCHEETKYVDKTKLTCNNKSYDTQNTQNTEKKYESYNDICSNDNIVYENKKNQYNKNDSIHSNMCCSSSDSSTSSSTSSSCNNCNSS
jgi:hypothetical protein